MRFTARRSAPDTRCYWRNCNPRNRQRRSVLDLVRGLSFEIDRAFARCGRCVLPRGDRHRTRAVTGETATRGTGSGAPCLISFVASRLKLTELSPVVVDAFYREEIGTGHALLLAKLQPAEQEEALSACYQEQ